VGTFLVELIWKKWADGCLLQLQRMTPVMPAKFKIPFAPQHASLSLQAR
jgi:hypothetical protein